MTRAVLVSWKCPETDRMRGRAANNCASIIISAGLAAIIISFLLSFRTGFLFFVGASGSYRFTHLFAAARTQYNNARNTNQRSPTVFTYRDGEKHVSKTFWVFSGFFFFNLFLSFFVSAISMGYVTPKSSTGRPSTDAVRRENSTRTSVYTRRSRL